MVHRVTNKYVREIDVCMLGSRNKAVIVIAVLAAMLFSAVPFATSEVSGETASEGSTYTGTVFNCIDHTSNTDLAAGGSSTFEVIVTNKNAYLENDLSDNILVYVSASVKDSSGNTYGLISVSIKNESGNTVPEVEGNLDVRFTFTLNADQFAKQKTYSVAYTVEVTDMSKTVLETANLTHTVTVSSSLSNEGTYNKFLGYIDNNFSGVFGQVWFTALVSFFGWILIGIAIMFVAVPIVTFLMTKKDNPERPALRKSLIRQCSIIILVFTIVNVLCVLGVSESVTDTVKKFAHLIYLIIGLGIAWQIYKTALDRISDNMQGRDLITGGSVDDFNAFKPLFLYIGEIVVAVIGVSVGLGMLGVDVAAIVTSAGVVSLGISFGAKEVIGQFFSGLVILTTRPFVKGDLIQLSKDGLVYKVRKVNVMFTELVNWDNSDVTLVPNNVITSSNVKNITRDTLRTKIHLFMEVGYGTDLTQARAAMLEVANANPRVIKDGSVDRPYTRVTAFNDSNIELRLTVWVDDYNDHGTITGDLRAAVYEKFNQLGIPIDYQQVVIHYADEQQQQTTD